MRFHHYAKSCTAILIKFSVTHRSSLVQRNMIYNQVIKMCSSVKKRGKKNKERFASICFRYHRKFRRIFATRTIALNKMQLFVLKVLENLHYSTACFFIYAVLSHRNVALDSSIDLLPFLYYATFVVVSNEVR